MLASSFDDDYSSYKLETKFFGKPQGVPDIRGYINDEQKRKDPRKDNNLGKPIGSKYQPFYVSRIHIGSSDEKCFVIPTRLKHMDSGERVEGIQGGSGILDKNPNSEFASKMALPQKVIELANKYHRGE